MIDQPALTDGVVWLTPFTKDDGVAIGDFNLDEAIRRWFDQPPVDPDPAARRLHGEEVAERWRASWTTGEALAFAVRLAPDGESIGMAELQPSPTASPRSRTRSCPRTGGADTPLARSCCSPMPVSTGSASRASSFDATSTTSRRRAQPSAPGSRSNGSI